MPFRCLNNALFPQVFADNYATIRGKILYNTPKSINQSGLTH